MKSGSWTPCFWLCQGEGEPQETKPPGRLKQETDVVTVTSRIEVNPKVMFGKPVIRGTRIPVELILRKLSEGATEADLLDAYPRLEREDIRAALAYAADWLAHEETVATGSADAGSGG